MAYAKNGAAIIGGEIVPASEVKVLKALTWLNQAATVPQIAAAMDNEMSDASLYSLLGRLDERRRLVARQVVAVDVHGTSLRRVLWTAHQAAIEFFNNTEALGDPRFSKTENAPGRAAGQAAEAAG